MNESDQREYFRIDDHLTIEYRSVDADEFERLRDVIRFNPSYAGEKAVEMHFLGDVVTQQKGEDKELFAYLRVIEKKLDMVLELLGQQKDSSGYKSVTTHMNISGAGIRFASDEALKEGERLEVRLALPIAPFPKILTLCEVVRVGASPDEAEGRWCTAVKFLEMNDFDRDVLINYIFTKEREKLRAEKGTG